MKRKIHWRCWYAAIIGAVLSVLIISVPAAQLTETAHPAAVVEKFNTTLLEVMHGGKQIGYAGRYALLAPIIRETFAFNRMARISTGKYWQTMSDDQRRRLIDLYREWSTATYAQRFDNFDGQRFEIAPSSEQKGNRASVDSHMIKKTGEEIPFLYQLVKIDNQWQIIDIHVKGVSQLANTRAQFVSVLKKEGFPELERTLMEKIEELSS